MKILAIVGSPRKGGNTDAVIDRVLAGAKSKDAEVEKVYLRDLNISPCQGGFTCEIAKNCVIPDDMRHLSTKIRAANGIVVGTPVYMGNVSGLFLNFLNRCRPFLSYVDALGMSSMSPTEENALLEERTCFELWKGDKTYVEVTILVESLMDKRIRCYYDQHGSHPAAAKRLVKGKKSVIILCYGQHVENRYPGIVDSLKTTFEVFWATAIVDTLSVCGVVKRGDAQSKDDLMERAFQAGQQICEEGTESS